MAAHVTTQSPLHRTLMLVGLKPVRVAGLSLLQGEPQPLANGSYSSMLTPYLKRGGKNPSQSSSMRLAKKRLPESFVIETTSTTSEANSWNSASHGELRWDCHMVTNAYYFPWQLIIVDLRRLRNGGRKIFSQFLFSETLLANFHEGDCATYVLRLQ